MSHKRTNSTEVAWYTDAIGPKLGPTARQILEEYSKVPPDQLESHVSKIRDQAWQIWPYPCIGQYRFLDFSITLSPHYASVLSTLKASPSALFLDLGCGFGQDVRALAAAGVPSAQLVGSDVRREFWELGYALFNDEATLRSRFVEADLLADANGLGPLTGLAGKVDVVYVGSLLHLFDYVGQVAIVGKIVQLLRPEKGAVVLGRQVGNTVAGETPRKTADAKRMYRHNEESFAKMWEEVGVKTGTKWKVETEMDEGDKMGSARWDPNFKDLKFTVIRE